MKGEIFNLLEQFIVENWGEVMFEDLYTKIHESLITKEPFVGPGTYPDSDFFSIISAACERLGVTPDQAAHAFGNFAFPHLLQKFPNFLENYQDARSVLRSLHSVIHVEVRKLYRDAETPYFEFLEMDGKNVSLVYESKRRLFSFVEGMLESLGKYYDEPLTYMRRNEKGDRVEFVITFM